MGDRSRYPKQRNSMPSKTYIVEADSSFELTINHDKPVAIAYTRHEPFQSRTGMACSQWSDDSGQTRISKFPHKITIDNNSYAMFAFVFELPDEATPGISCTQP